MKKTIQNFDFYFIKELHWLEVPLAKFAIFVIYFWFGLLKLLGVSPAGPLVETLFEKTLEGLIAFPVFYMAFALFEMAIGILFLVPKLERVAILLIAFHLGMIVLPLFLLPHITWQSFLVPTLEGQYIIKNILIAAAAVVVGSKLTPLGKKS